MRSTISIQIQIQLKSEEDELQLVYQIKKLSEVAQGVLSYKSYQIEMFSSVDKRTRKLPIAELASENFSKPLPP